MHIAPQCRSGAVSTSIRRRSRQGRRVRTGRPRTTPVAGRGPCCRVRHPDRGRAAGRPGHRRDRGARRAETTPRQRGFPDSRGPRIGPPRPGRRSHQRKESAPTGVGRRWPQPTRSTQARPPRSRHARSSAAILTPPRSNSSGGSKHWREEGEVGMVASGAHRRLIRTGERVRWAAWAGTRRGLCYARHDKLCHAAWSRSR